MRRMDSSIIRQLETYMTTDPATRDTLTDIFPDLTTNTVERRIALLQTRIDLYEQLHHDTGRTYVPRVEAFIRDAKTLIDQLKSQEEMNEGNGAALDEGEEDEKRTEGGEEEDEEEEEEETDEETRIEGIWRKLEATPRRAIPHTCLRTPLASQVWVIQTTSTTAYQSHRISYHHPIEGLQASVPQETLQSWRNPFGPLITHHCNRSRARGISMITARERSGSHLTSPSSGSEPREI